MQWIEEKRLAESRNLGRSLTEATNMLKKHDQLDAEVAAHQPRVEATLQKGQKLIHGNHISSAHIREKCDNVIFLLIYIILNFLVITSLGITKKFRL